MTRNSLNRKPLSTADLWRSYLHWNWPFRASQVPPLRQGSVPHTSGCSLHSRPTQTHEEFCRKTQNTQKESKINYYLKKNVFEYALEICSIIYNLQQYTHNTYFCHFSILKYYDYFEIQAMRLGTSHLSDPNTTEQVQIWHQRQPWATSYGHWKLATSSRKVLEANNSGKQAAWEHPYGESWKSNTRDKSLAAPALPLPLTHPDINNFFWLSHSKMSNRSREQSQIKERRRLPLILALVSFWSGREGLFHFHTDELS